MKKKDSRILRQRKRRIRKRLQHRNVSPEKPVFEAANIHYEMADRTRAIGCGGIGAFHRLAQNSGLVDAIDQRLHVLKIHLPYHESDHVLNIAYNALCGGMCLDDIELLRNDETYLDALGAERIPDPTTAGDFARRFSQHDVMALMNAINGVRTKVWQQTLTKAERELAILDLDGTYVPTTGECKEGMGLAYNGEWGYHVLLASLANTKEPLGIENRPGGRPSYEGAPEWVARLVPFLRQTFAGVCLRGDTDFALTTYFDKWDDEGTLFAFGKDARKNLVEKAQALRQRDWTPLTRREKRKLKTLPRERPRNVKEAIVQEKGFKNIMLEAEHIAEITYSPTACKRGYRLIILRKDLTIERGDSALLHDVVYLFYITNIQDKSPAEVVFFCNDRCDQENLIAQLKGGVRSLRAPLGDLVSNWAYMVMTSLAWTLKAWFALLTHHRKRRQILLRMEFRGFQNAIVRMPCQIVKGARRLTYRILSYSDWRSTFLSTFERIGRLQPT